VMAAPRAAIAYTRNPAQRNSRCFPRDILTLIPPPRDGHEDMLPLSYWSCGDALDITTQYGRIYDARGTLLVDFSSSFFAVRLEGPSQLGPVRHAQFGKQTWKLTVIQIYRKLMIHTHLPRTWTIRAIFPAWRGPSVAMMT
jgi:hypothetical protein